MEFTTNHHGKKVQDCCTRKALKELFEVEIKFVVLLVTLEMTAKQFSLERNPRSELEEWTQN